MEPCREARRGRNERVTFGSGPRSRRVAAAGQWIRELQGSPPSASSSTKSEFGLDALTESSRIAQECRFPPEATLSRRSQNPQRASHAEVENRYGSR
jgi:hypothetical protein